MNDSDDIYKTSQRIFLNRWKDYGAEKMLISALELAKIIRYFVFALSFSRIKSCPHIEQYSQFNGYIADALRHLIKGLID